ncbi:uncharacterized protein LY89DRAFT_779519 [Mollisia scopiformis]|uniref:Ubiquitin-like protease family profile domain-containing protein n=1 Tax=Mollisia scopiformis TaxID=149040 RepID=A0A194XKW9_MOLSC|nr:uncharacterized protein LY89DRAFT_779519 [Mollisia scopiformis]KUJ20823.1 hypothetical protein LY89DRAFT_779519 [Mollisia scopiformis]
MISQVDYDAICNPTAPATTQSEIRRVLDKIDCNGANFLNLDYLFIPYYEDTMNHFWLMGIAPKQKFCFLIDSCPFDHWDDPIQGMRDIIINQTLSLPGASLKTAWPLYGQWSQRTATDDGSPDAPQQSDSYNCGVFTVTNTFCLAFGYDILCYSQEDLPKLKRRRMTAELRNGGFGANNKFHYPLLDLPGNTYSLLDTSRKADQYYKDRNLSVPRSSGRTSSPPRPDLSYRPPPFLAPNFDPMDTADPDDDPQQMGFEPPVWDPTVKTRTQLKRIKKLDVPKNLDKYQETEILEALGSNQRCSALDPRSDPDTRSESSDDGTNDGCDSDTDDQSGPVTPRPIPTSNELFVAARKLLDGADCAAKTAYMKRLLEMDDRPWPPQFN